MIKSDGRARLFQFAPEYVNAEEKLAFTAGSPLSGVIQAISFPAGLRLISLIVPVCWSLFVIFILLERVCPRFVCMKVSLI